MTKQHVTEPVSPCIAYAPNPEPAAPTDAQAEAELSNDVDDLMNRISLLSGRARELRMPQLMYALNRAWREIDTGRQL